MKYFLLLNQAPFMDEYRVKYLSSSHDMAGIEK
jgi:hypothetical protein